MLWANSGDQIQDRTLPRTKKETSNHYICDMAGTPSIYSVSRYSLGVQVEVEEARPRDVYLV